MNRDDMNLPAGKTCVDCYHYDRCRALIGPDVINERQTKCDFLPRRFLDASPPREYEERKL